MRAIIYFVGSMLFLLMGWHDEQHRALSVSPHTQSKHETGPVSPTTDPATAKELQRMWDHILAKEKIKPPIWAITLQRDPGMEDHPPPWYALTLRRDGTATYIGYAFTDQIGTYQAFLSPSKFMQIAQLIQSSHFVRFKPYYGSTATDIRHITVSVAGRRTRKTVDDAGEPIQQDEEEAPKTLKQIELMIDAAVVGAHWIKVNSNTDLPSYSPRLNLIL